MLLAAVACADQDQNKSIEHANLAAELYQQKEFTRAIKELRAATTVDPSNHNAWYMLGFVLGQQNDWREAADAFGEAVKYAGEQAMYHYKLGQALYNAWDADRTGRGLDLAQTHLEKAVDLNPRLYKAHWLLGKVYYNDDQPAKAAAAWTESAKLDPGFGKSFIDLGKLYIKWDHIAQAIAVLEQGTLGHVLDPRELTDIYYYLGLAYDAQQSWDKAIEAYTKAIEQRKDNVDARRQRGFSYAQKGDVAKARQDLEEFVKQRGSVPGESPGLEVQAANDVLMRLTSM
jgi:tetratricopeptide (TPR) repeat protein